MGLIDILLVILIIAASALCIVLIYFIWKITNSVKAMQAEISELSHKLQPLIESTTDLSNNIKEITDDARAHVNLSKNVITNVKDRVDTILNFEENVRKGIEGPVMSFIREIAALNNGLVTFLGYFRNKNS